jgi:isochorismate synthase
MCMDVDYSFFDTLISQNQSFSLYRTPESGILVFVLQMGTELQSFKHLSELNGKEGFTLAPFMISSQNPVVLIHPDITLTGDKEIFDFLSKTVMHSKIEKLQTSLTQMPGSEIQTKYRKAFEIFKAAIHSNICKKVVLSRRYTINRSKQFSSGKTFEMACMAYPDAFVYLCHTPLTGTWCGCSPELLLSAKGLTGQTVALAGTTKISGYSETCDWDLKNREEQQLVSDYLEALLQKEGLFFSKDVPYTVKAGKLMHLKTVFDFQIKNREKLGDLLESLHPTPAVCGYPRKEAYRLIAEKEGYDRSYYSGFTGMLSSTGDTDLYVNLRCMKIEPESLTFFAGGGLLASSDVETEWEETEEKLKTMLSLVQS